MRNIDMLNSMKRAVIVAGAATALLAPIGSAQSAAGPRLTAWLGCWTTTEAVLGVPGRTVCITPTADPNVVDIATIADGKVTSHDLLNATGNDATIKDKNCSGVQKAQFSADERRLYVRGATTCDNVKSTTSGILSMTAQGEWISVLNTKTYGDNNVRVARYHDAGLPSSLPPEIQAALNGRSMSIQSARIAAGAAVGTRAVIDAAKNVDSSVVSAWLLERGQRFDLSANDLISLADAGVPAAVTDAMIAVSNPGVFEVARADGRSAEETAYPANRRVYGTLDPYYDPYGYGYSRYGYGYSPYGYYGGYSGGYYGGYYGAPIVVVTPGTSTSNRGQMVKGHGYTQNQPGSTQNRGSSERTSSSSGSSSTSSSSSGSSSSGSSQPSSAPAPTPAPQRTAVPKP